MKVTRQENKMWNNMVFNFNQYQDSHISIWSDLRMSTYYFDLWLAINGAYKMLELKDKNNLTSFSKEKL